MCVHGFLFSNIFLTKTPLTKCALCGNMLSLNRGVILSFQKEFRQAINILDAVAGVESVRRPTERACFRYRPAPRKIRKKYQPPSSVAKKRFSEDVWEIAACLDSEGKLEGRAKPDDIADIFCRRGHAWATPRKIRLAQRQKAR